MSGNSKKKYILELLIDGKKAKSSILEDIKKALKAHGLSVTLKQTKAKHSFLSIEGTLESIDEGHSVVIEFNEKKRLPIVRITDQAGDEIRRRAYVVLADIEQMFRALILRTTTEILGFDWWEDYVPQVIRSNVQKRISKKEKPTSIPIEFTTFEELLNLIDAKVPKWAEDKVLTPEDLREIIKDSDSLNQVLAKLDSKTKALSLGDEVFSLYFNDKQQWSAVKAILRFAIQERNAVMHHRLVRLGAVKELKEKRRKLKHLLKQAKDELEPREKEVALKALQGLKIISDEALRSLHEAIQNVTAGMVINKQLIGHIHHPVMPTINIVKQFEKQFQVMRRVAGLENLQAIRRFAGLNFYSPEDHSEE